MADDIKAAVERVTAFSEGLVHRMPVDVLCDVYPAQAGDRGELLAADLRLLLSRAEAAERERDRLVEALRPAVREAVSFMGIMLSSPFWRAAVDPVRAEVTVCRDGLRTASQLLYELEAKSHG